MVRLVLIFLMLTALPAAADRLERVSIRLDGYTRSYLKYVPDSALNAGPRPLVVVLHGGGGTARGLVRLTRQRFNRLAARDGVIVIYPDALDKVWDFGEGQISNALDRRVNDLRYFAAVLEQVRTTHSIDNERIFATGMSRGGQASFFLACKMPGRFRAIAPVVMPLPAYLEDDCRGIPPTGLLVMNGTADPIVPYDGGWIMLRNQRRDQVLSTDRTEAIWRQLNGCTGAAQSRQVGAVTIRESSGCRAPVLRYRIEGGGHTWPGGGQYLPRFLIGPTNRDINAADEIWTFFRRFF